MLERILLIVELATAQCLAVARELDATIFDYVFAAGIGGGLVIALVAFVRGMRGRDPEPIEALKRRVLED